MPDLQLLAAGYARLRQGTLWASYAKANPGEAAKIDAYVAGLAAGKQPVPPVVATATGTGLVQILRGGYQGR